MLKKYKLAKAASVGSRVYVSLLLTTTPTMYLLPIATLATYGSLITVAKSAWELSRLVRKKVLEMLVEKEARAVSRDLHTAYRYGTIRGKDYEEWYRAL